MPYLPPLDGIRAIAILAVVIFHISPEYLRGGFTGVDVFFVLSGFLLGSIILHDIGTGSFSLREFYLRRIERLAPNLILTVVAVVALWSRFFPPSATKEVARHGLWTLVNLSNFFIWRNFGGYWGERADLAPLLHTWSLAVEEQFYLVFPALLMLLVRFQRARVRLWLLIAGALSLGLCIWLTPRHSPAAFYMLPTRIWELLLGAALACTGSAPSSRVPRVLRETAGWTGLALMTIGFLSVGERGFPGSQALVPVIGTLLVIVSATGETKIARLLSTPALVGTGKLSYSLYLWHWPLITFGKFQAELNGTAPEVGAAAGAAASLVLASMAYYFVERPLRRREPGRRWRLSAISAGFLAGLVALGCVANFTPPVNTSRYFDQPAFYGRLYSAGRVSNELAGAIRFQDVYFPPLEAGTNDRWRYGGIVHYFGGATPEVVVLGSSHALMYARLIDSICRQNKQSVAFLAVDGAPIFFDVTLTESFPTVAESIQFNEARRQWLHSWHPRALLMIERWDSYANSEEEFNGRLHALLQEVSPLTERVLFVAQPPVIAVLGNNLNLREWAAGHMPGKDMFPKLFPDRNESKRRLSVAAAEAAVAGFPNLRVVRPDRAFYESDGAIRWVRGRTVYYADDDHLSDAGAESVRSVFESALSEAARVVSTDGGMAAPESRTNGQQ